ncbi:hypothetical protein ANCCAN_15357 [Ancylostoma caninum]|uniref:Uncharacterized protein n=1 Tax=Ancylostoma caninum TaxID=29170 RepID=A0A368G7P0_ANCCA|nr:hypothetical protein ANCCAN_15357 [Ancylostoma caninum]
MAFCAEQLVSPEDYERYKIFDESGYDSLIPRYLDRANCETATYGSILLMEGSPKMYLMW